MSLSVAIVELLTCLLVESLVKPPGPRHITKSITGFEISERVATRVRSPRSIPSAFEVKSSLIVSEGQSRGHEAHQRNQDLMKQESMSRNGKPFQVKTENYQKFHGGKITACCCPINRIEPTADYRTQMLCNKALSPLSKSIA